MAFHTAQIERDQALSKVPEVTLWFWIVKILCTTLGETGGDAVTMSMNLGYAAGVGIFAAIFAVAVWAQAYSKAFHPYLYWTAIVATTTLGTALADFFDRSLGIGYAGGATSLFLLLLLSIAIWYWSEGSVSVQTITNPRVEAFYWTTIMFSQTLGTALGDWVAATDRGGFGLGYEWGAVVFGAALALVAAAYYRTKISPVLLFWAAFVLTRPLGATLGDFLDKPIGAGGMHISRYYASAVLAGLIIVCVAILPQRAGRHPGEERATS
ncbi:MAG: hypothetical protein WCC41_00025 [Rhodomicrobium sp.]